MTTNSAQQLVATNQLRDIKPPVEIPNPWLWLWWTLGALALFAIVALLVRRLRKRQQTITAAPTVPAHLRARQKLDHALALIGQPKPFCVAVSDTVRFYLEERFNFHAPERTTEEFLTELSSTNLLLPDQKETLGDFLKRCDLVKFARYEPREAELRELHGSAIRLIDETEPVAEPASPNLQTAGADKSSIVNRKS
jgi:hypothetical protein